MSTSDRTAYRWEESDWYEASNAPNYQDSDEHHKRVDLGEGKEWGVAHDFREGTSKYAWLAHDIHKHVAPALCATTLLDPPDRGLEPLFAWLFDDDPIESDPDALHHENRAVELGKPAVRVPKTGGDQWGNPDYGQYRHRRRVNKETGYVSGGESTGIYLGDIPAERFLAVVDTVLAVSNLPPRQRREIRQYASSAKRDGNKRDVEILERVLFLVDNGIMRN